MIYYSHINEDSRVERNLLHTGRFAAAVAICGSGERVLALLDADACKRVAVVDNNEEALFLLQLKLVALDRLPVDEYLAFIGHCAMPRKERWQLFEEMKETLPLNTRAFWQDRKVVVQNGVLYAGHFEKFLQRLRPLTNFYLGKGFQTIFHPQATLNGFPHLRWRLLKKLFSIKSVYRLAGNRDAAFVGSGAETAVVPEALDAAIKKRNAASSFVAHLIFKGHLCEMPEDGLPPSLQRKTLTTIKKRLAANDVRIDYYAADVLAFVQQHTGSLKPPVFYSLSDILSFVDFAYLQELLKGIAVNGNLVVGRSFLRNRLTATQLEALRSYGEVRLHDAAESTGMYRVFSVESKPAK